jgi:H+/Cl- antiporter ClcA
VLPAGVLFALEEATSTWSHKLAWRCFLCTSFACFTLAQLHPRMQSGMLSFHGIYTITNLQVHSVWAVQGSEGCRYAPFGYICADMHA